MTDNIFLALGSNRGDRFKFIRESVDRIENNASCRVIKSSSVYETTPYGNADQPDFLNAVIKIRSEFQPAELLGFVKEVERIVGRKERTEKWGQREIDVDIIFYNDVIYSGDMMTIPHPECLKRDFVMIPLIEIGGEFVHPVLKKRIDEIDLTAAEKHIIRITDFKIIL